MDSLLKNGAQIYAFVYFGGDHRGGSARKRLATPGPGATLGLRWFGNFSLTIIGAVLVRVLFPLAGVGWAVFCSERRLGLFNQVPGRGWWNSR